MATTTLRRDYLRRKIVDPTGTAKDALGRNTTSTADYMGRVMYSTVFAGTTAVSLNAIIESAAGVVYQVTTAGTTAAGAPTAPGVGNTVVSGTATFTQLTNT